MAECLLYRYFLQLLTSLTTRSVWSAKVPFRFVYAARPTQLQFQIYWKISKDVVECKKDMGKRSFRFLQAANCIDDQQGLEQYIASFPIQDYMICDIPYQGKFYVEPHRNDVIKNFLRSNRIWEPHILMAIYKYAQPGTVVLDIGSHIGTFTIPMSHVVGTKGRVHAFEPQRKIYRELRKNCELNNAKNVTCHRIAIGDRQQIIEMEKETFHSETVLGNEGRARIGRGGDVAEMRTIDSFNLTNISLVKIDVESSEEQVLNGMINTILKNKPVIIFELQSDYIWESVPSDIKQKMINSVENLEKLGYAVVRIHLHDYLALPLNLFGVAEIISSQVDFWKVINEVEKHRILDSQSFQA